MVVWWIGAWLHYCGQMFMFMFISVCLSLCVCSAEDPRVSRHTGRPAGVQLLPVGAARRHWGKRQRQDDHLLAAGRERQPVKTQRPHSGQEVENFLQEETENIFLFRNACCPLVAAHLYPTILADSNTTLEDDARAPPSVCLIWTLSTVSPFFHVLITSQYFALSMWAGLPPGFCAG